MVEEVGCAYRCHSGCWWGEVAVSALPGGIAEKKFIHMRSIPESLHLVCQGLLS